ncbi:hypothetical protein [Zooshikella sp. RANM57]|uniref:hypothetical protein n=1 Tax=Zooshikella sp. RANM57 TaxID=3425863 RepID=UPI003D6ECFF4
MIIFGTRGKTVAGQVIQGIECPSCGKDEFITFGVLRYFHLYWIPTLVTSKQVGIECTHCKGAFVDKEIPKDLAKEIKSHVFTKKNTLPFFAGLIIIACIALFGVYASHQSDVKETSMIEQPAVNDLYIVNFTKIFEDADTTYKYGVMRVDHLSSTQMELKISKMAYNKASGVRKDIRSHKALDDAYYDSEPFYIDISKLQAMKASGAIYSVERI